MSPKIKNDWSWESWARPPTPEIMKMMVFGRPQSDIEKLLLPSEAEYFYEVFGPFCFEIYNKNDSPDTPRSLIQIFPGFR